MLAAVLLPAQPLPTEAAGKATLGKMPVCLGVRSVATNRHPAASSREREEFVVPMTGEPGVGTRAWST